MAWSGLDMWGAVRQGKAGEDIVAVIKRLYGGNRKAKGNRNNQGLV
jgi:hypothetical protein